LSRHPKQTSLKIEYSHVTVEMQFKLQNSHVILEVVRDHVHLSILEVWF